MLGSPQPKNDRKNGTKDVRNTQADAYRLSRAA
jgi:hypothetical protein